MIAALGADGSFLAVSFFKKKTFFTEMKDERQ